MLWVSCQLPMLSWGCEGCMWASSVTNRSVPTALAGVVGSLPLASSPLPEASLDLNWSRLEGRDAGCCLLLPFLGLSQLSVLYFYCVSSMLHTLPQKLQQISNFSVFYLFVLNFSQSSKHLELSIALKFEIA